MRVLETRALLPVRNIELAIAQYECLGFQIVRVSGGADAIANLGNGHLHLVETTLTPEESWHPAACDFLVTDADALYTKWAQALPGAALSAPSVTDNGTLEGRFVDIDANLIRFCSPTRAARSLATVKLLEEEAIASALSRLAGWERCADKWADAITRTYTFGSFADAIAFMAQGATQAEALNHHPEWTNTYTTVHVVLSTHDVGGITSLDIELARQLDQIFAALHHR